MRDYLKKTEFWSAMILLLLHMVLFPIALSVLLSLYPQLLTETEANLLYYAVTTTLVFLLLGRYLRRSFDSLIDNIFGCLKSFGLGIIVFFNHFSRKKLHNDPTPIEIEICTYEEDSNKTMLERAEREGKTIDAD